MSFLVAFNLGVAAEVAAPPADTLSEEPGGGVRIRIGIASDLEEIEIPCCSPGAEVLLGSERHRLSAVLKVTPVGAGASPAGSTDGFG